MRELGRERQRKVGPWDGEKENGEERRGVGG